MPPRQPSPKLKRAIAFAAAIGLFVLLGLFTYSVVHLQQVSDRVNANQRSTILALCALRGDLEARVKSSNDFLDKHPNGIPGIPVATIQQSIDNENRTINALAPVPCPRATRAKHPKHH